MYDPGAFLTAASVVGLVMSELVREPSKSRFLLPYSSSAFLYVSLLVLKAINIYYGASSSGVGHLGHLIWDSDPSLLKGACCGCDIAPIPLVDRHTGGMGPDQPASLPSICGFFFMS